MTGGEEQMSAVTLRNVTKIYPTGVTAVDSFDLTVPDGEIMVLLGPTGCGKSTVLRLIAGLDAPTEGEILLGDRPIQSLPSRDRGVAMVFQDYGLYPHFTVAENIVFPLRVHHVDDATAQRRVREVADMLGLTDLLHRRPGQLSGGQRQRVAIARAIVREPAVFLLDEPLSNLDAAVRETVRTEVLELIRALGVTTIYVTHDQTEALCLGDRVAVMRRGRIEQLGTPEDVYGNPRRLFVAAFVGSPRMNLLQAAVHVEPGVRTLIDFGAQAISLPWEDPRALALAPHHTARITVGVRPDAVTLSSADDAVRALVTMVERRGHEVVVHLETGSAPTPHLLSHLELPDAHGELADIGQELAHLPTGVDPAHALLRRLGRMVPHQRRPDESERVRPRASFPPAESGREAQSHRESLGDMSMRVPTPAAPRAGDTIGVAIDVDRLFLFDRAGDRISLPVASGVDRPPGAVQGATAATEGST
jgi:multiple sugar transport system ATP-binding protein